MVFIGFPLVGNYNRSIFASGAATDSHQVAAVEQFLDFALQQRFDALAILE